MNERPDTKYAWNGDVALAYQVFGDGPVDLVYMQGFSSHVDLNWESPFLARFLRGLGQLARVMHMTVAASAARTDSRPATSRLSRSRSTTSSR